MDKVKSFVWDKGYHSGLLSALETVDSCSDIDTAISELKKEIGESREDLRKLNSQK